jgi:hypothetical protein
MYFLLLFLVSEIQAQDFNAKSTIAVLDIDSKGFTLDPAQMGNITRVELDKISVFQVMDRYDVEYLAQKNNLNVENCYGKLCLIDVGKALKTDKILAGSVEFYGESIVVTFRLIDIGTERVEKTQVMEFLNLRNQVQLMIGLTLKRMFDLPIDPDLESKLTRKFDYDNAINNPEVNQLNLSGPRMGVTFFSGEAADVYRASKKMGGFDAMPVMFQFGYQFEVKYLNEGNFQALFEFIPTITGLDQGFFIPSIAILNGLRHNRNGLEFAFGPTLTVTKTADGYYDALEVWHLEEDWAQMNEGISNPYEIEKRLDSRGSYNISSGFVFALGKTFKSGRLNIPVNAFFIPGRNESHRFGISMGFNTTRY